MVAFVLLLPAVLLAVLLVMELAELRLQAERRAVRVEQRVGAERSPVVDDARPR